MAFGTISMAYGTMAFGTMAFGTILWHLAQYCGIWHNIVAFGTISMAFGTILYEMAFGTIYCRKSFFKSHVKGSLNFVPPGVINNEWFLIERF